ncbi:MAG TPA: DUF2807 domain-containing protein [Cyclobacteriaceae bacterium]|jgi:hypothetical protein|nr:DUF2807 domain-containing protein [Cytophagales bacterium]HNT49022.1 DUF2807 domain-containing protein [Cyclobacteriaceae bacterium]HRE65471.1 DUF2807 domain-containing protein [Cyclobacteriaceae bacterium]HRF32611.1 DUF2807 domain-containing protein [Cyclobacteriaceae bacterium]
MKRFNIIFLLTTTIWLTSCLNDEDPGPRQQDIRSFAVVDFDRIEAGDALDVTIVSGTNYSIKAEGDRRNLDDLEIFKRGNALILRFDENENRQYTTFITITMPALAGVNFSGAVNGKVSGFDDVERLDVTLSGASLGQIDMDATEIFLNINGASQLRLKGEGELMDGIISGASVLTAFEYEAVQAQLHVSGASQGRVTVSQKLQVVATGASEVIYRGEPELIVETSGASVVKKD